MLNLLRDANKWVRASAYKNLGKFIHELKGMKINEKLVLEFCRMVDADVVSLGK
jgi:serine/threonine-protein phosphatase 4 regulatory subunit 1